MKTAEYWIQYLELLPHPEGGYFKETARSGVVIPAGSLSGQPGNDRNLYTSILFLLKAGTVSRFHRLKSDELWYYHYGDPMIIECIDENGNHYTDRLGAGEGEGEKLQAVIPSGTIFGAKTTGEGNYSLVGCMVSPGFDFSDFKLFDREELLQLYPQHRSLILEFT